MVTDFVRGSIPLTAFTALPKVRKFAIEGEPEMVNGVMRELRTQFRIIFEGEYPLEGGRIGKEVVYREE
jgi:hypothetical protein